jgi:RNA-directed DNA polymerase
MPELMGKLDTSVNGPEGLPLFDGDAWERVDWRHHEEQVRRLRGRIFKAVQDGDWPLARNLQKLMLRGPAGVHTPEFRSSWACAGPSIGVCAGDGVADGPEP